MDLTASYEREIEHKPLNNVVFYGILAAFVIFITAIYGIKPSVKTLVQNQKYKKELTLVQSNMKTKINQIEQEVLTINEYTDEIKFMEIALPREILFEQFLEEFVLMAAEAGFVVQRVQIGDTLEDEAQILLEMQGKMDDLPILIKNIEKMNRFVVIESIVTSDEDEFLKISTRLKVFTL